MSRFVVTRMYEGESFLFAVFEDALIFAVAEIEALASGTPSYEEIVCLLHVMRVDTPEQFNAYIRDKIWDMQISDDWGSAPIVMGEIK